jgi:hypothetical protein
MSDSDDDMPIAALASIKSGSVHASLLCPFRPESIQSSHWLMNIPCPTTYLRTRSIYRGKGGAGAKGGGSSEKKKKP